MKRTSFTSRRHTLLSIALTSALVPLERSVRAAGVWPDRPIKWLLPYQPGTGPDNTARILAEVVGPLLGQPIIVENRGGAAGNIGARLAAKAPADGYTWVYSAAPMAANMRIYKQPGYDALRDFRHVMRLSSSDVVLIVHPDSDIDSVQTLAAQLRAAPGKFEYASGGVGTPSHLGVELMLNAMGARALHVPYKGALELTTAVLGKQVVFGMPILSVPYQQIQAGQLRALAVAGPHRNPMLAQVPTLIEVGFPGVELVSWGGISVPVGTPDAVVERIRAALTTAMQQSRVIESLQAQGGRVDLQDAQTYTRGFVAEMAFTEAMMQHVGLEPI